jgi:hypothetical protein
MSTLVDNLLAYRILTLLVKPFSETSAFKVGVIDSTGNILIKPADRTREQRDTMTYLDRLVFNLKRLLNKIPGGDNRLKNIVAAFFLLKESYIQKDASVDFYKLSKVLKLQEEGFTFVEEQLLVEEFMSVCIQEDAPANATGTPVSTDQTFPKKRRFARFVVNDEIYNKFANGKTKFKKWNQYLNLEDEGQKQIYHFAKSNPKGVIILHNGKETKAIRFNRTGGGQWGSIKRKPKE